MDSKSGGKIVSKRYRLHNTTPYDRVSESSEPAQKNPNWLARVIFPATRVITSGASKILSSVFDSDDSSSSSSLSSPPESGDASENDDNADNICSLNEEHREPQRNCNKSYGAEQVEQLLIQGNFTRQECDRFIEIINSRTLDSDLKGEDEELRSKAVMEARKWLEQKKFESNPISNLADEVGSPIDVAKQYLKTRTPWTCSPNSDHFELRTPTTMASPFQEGTSMGAGHEISSLFKKRSSLASGSWNIDEEIRSVRAKATEDMLKSSPSMRNTKTFYESSSPIHAMTNPLISRREEDGGKELNSERSTVLAIPAISMFEKHNPKTAVSDLSPSFPDNNGPDSHSNDPKSLKMDDEFAKLEGTHNVNALPTEQDNLSAENVNGDEHDDNIANAATFLSEASVEVPVMEETDTMANVTVVNSDNFGGDTVDERMLAKVEARKLVRSSRRGGRGKGVIR